jgi:dienelactone hydrolase
MRPFLSALLALIPLLVEGQGQPAWPVLKPSNQKEALPGTKLLEAEGDLSIKMVEGIDQFLDAEIAAAMKRRGDHGGTREELARKLGLPRDSRPKGNAFLYVSSKRGPYAKGSKFSVHRIRWKAFGAVEAAGLLLEPVGEPLMDLIVLPEAGHSPEQSCGIKAMGDDFKSLPHAGRLAALGCRVIVPVLIDRGERHAMPTREWLHRSAWELGRTLAGYEVHKVLAAVDCLKHSQGGKARKIGIIGWGEGGRLALYAAALDERIDGAVVSGYFGPRELVWDEPADRTVFGLLDGHSDAEIARLLSPRLLLIERGRCPSYGFRLGVDGLPERLNRGAGKRGKPGRLLVHTPEQELEEFAVVAKDGAGSVELLGDGSLDRGVGAVLLDRLGIRLGEGSSPEFEKMDLPGDQVRELVKERQSEQVAALDRHNQWALIDSERVRDELFGGVNTNSVEEFQKSTRALREKFSKEVIGEFASLQTLSEPRPRTRALQEGPKTISYEVVLDVHEDVFAYGILTLPKDLKLDGKERRPVVVCQHGLEGRPQDTVGEPSHHYYKAFATRLAERGFITFSPQNIYLGHDLFRILQFKANAVGCTLFSVAVPQHRQITNWLADLPFVDSERIGFYGLSYGGKSAMRIPPLVDRYCLSICSADFNEWIWKNAATDSLSARHSYANKGEYEIFEFDLGNTFNYYEMAALICPRPFMVERGHFDGVAPDRTVAYEYAKVRFLYAAKLGLGDQTEIEWFVGPHTINGSKTYEFLHRHLKWSAPQ